MTTTTKRHSTKENAEKTKKIPSDEEKRKNCNENGSMEISIAHAIII